MPAETLQELENRLGKISDLRSVVSAMKSLAAVNIRHFEEAATAADRYYQNVQLALHVLITNKPEKVQLGDLNEEEGIIIAIGSDQGLVGQFNEVVGEKVHENILRHRSRKGERIATLFVLGLRIESTLLDRGHPVNGSLSMAGNLDDVVEIVRDVLELIAGDEFRARPVWVVFNRPKGGSSYKTVSRRILPLDRNILSTLQEKPWEGPTLPIIRYSWDKLFREVIREYLFNTIYSAIVESMTSENAARLAAMQAAEKNIIEKEEEARSRYNLKRQSSITEELLDIVSGFETITSKKRIISTS